jgi:hypothetical protein
MTVLNVLLAVVFVWGVTDLVVGMGTLLSLLVILFVRLVGRKQKVGYSKEELERMFGPRPPDLPPVPDDVDEDGIPWLK